MVLLTRLISNGLFYLLSITLISNKVLLDQTVPFISNIVYFRGYFNNKWQTYLTQKGLLDGRRDPLADMTDADERDSFYTSLSFDGVGGASGHDAPMIALVSRSLIFYLFLNHLKHFHYSFS